MKTSGPEAKIESLSVSVYRVPTDFPEADGTLEWNATTMVLAEIKAAGKTGVGYTYASRATAELIHELLLPRVVGADALSPPAIWNEMIRAIRNQGRPGICSTAIAAVDTALWDLKARVLNLPLVSLLGAVRKGIPVYGSGGFTSYPIPRLQEQLANWVKGGITTVKMKIGRDAHEDIRRVHAAREAIGPGAHLFVDANGGYDCKQAIGQAEAFARDQVVWFEEPVSSDDLEGLRFIRDHAPARMEIAAGEYGYDLFYFRRMLEAGAVDVLQADATRCGGFTGMMQVADLTDAFQTPLSAHTAPALHLHVCCALPRFRHLEYFRDHVRIEKMFFDGAQGPLDGILFPDLTRPGIGLEFKRKDADPFAFD